MNVKHVSTIEEYRVEWQNMKYVVTKEDRWLEGEQVWTVHREGRDNVSVTERHQVVREVQEFLLRR